MRENVLYISEDGFEEAFSSQRALSRNRVIHTLGVKTFVAQSSLKMGGTWDGTVKNLRFGWSPVFCFDDGSEGIRMLEQMGAEVISLDGLRQFSALRPKTENLLAGF
jgi:predicted Rossmann fold nucleotide-binding protein DprA/Smf involved in DNA uptake